MSIIRSAFWVSVPQFLSIGISFITTPIYLHFMGKSQYGLLVLYTMILGYLGAIDIGFTLGAFPKIMEIKHQGDHQKLSSASLTYIIVMFFIGLAGFLLALAGTHFICKQLNIQDVIPGWLLGMVFWIGCLNTSFSFLLRSTEKFVFGAIFDMCMICINTGCILYQLFYVEKSCVSYFKGFLIAGIVSLIAYIIFSMFFKFFNNAKPSWGIAMNFLKDGKKQYPSHMIALWASSVDRLILGTYANRTALADYTLSAKVPDILARCFFPLYYPIRSALTKAKLESKESLEKQLLHYSNRMFWFSCVFIMVPCAGCKPLLDLWIGPYVADQANEIAALMGLYWAIDHYYQIWFSYAMLTQQPKIMLWSSLWNTGLTAICTLFFYNHFGLMGVAMMNVILVSIQYFGLIIYSIKKGNLNISFYKVIQPHIGMFLITLPFIFLNYGFSEYASGLVSKGIYTLTPLLICFIFLILMIKIYRLDLKELRRIRG